MSWLNLTRDRVTPKTTGRRLTSLRSFGKWAGIADPLYEYIAPTPGRPIPHPISEGVEGLERMIEKAKNAEQSALVGLCGFAGLRIGEALAMKCSNLDLQDMMLTVRGKGDRTRIIPINTRAWSAVSSAYVLAYSKPETFLISYKDRFARKIISNLGLRANLQRPISSQDLRATFGTTVYDHCLDLRVTQELLGHSSSSTTEIYTGVGLHTMRSAIDF